MRRLLCTLSLAFLSLFLLRPAAALPRVTLKLEGVGVHEALRRVSSETGWRLALDDVDVNDPQPRARPEKAGATASFDWSNAPLGKVCRDLAAAYGYAFEAEELETHEVRFFAPEQKAPAAPKWAARVPGLTCYVGEIARTETRVLTPEGEDLEAETSVRLHVRPDDADPDAIRAIENLRVTDDRGKVLELEPVRRNWWGERPDEWVSEVYLDELRPRVRRIARLDGEVVLYRVVETRRLEVPVRGQTLPLDRSLQPLEINISRLEYSPTVPFGRLGVALEATWPAEGPDLVTDLEEQGWPAPAVRLSSGKLVTPDWRAVIFPRQDRQVAQVDISLRVSPDDPPQALVWDMVVRSQPSQRVPFSIQDIPLPGGRGAPEPAPEAPPARGKPNLDPQAPPVGEAITGLAGAVLIDDRPAVQGELAVGLRKKNGDGGWGPVRWRYLPLDRNGQARLEGVAPGEYRVVREYRTRGADGRLQPASGKWAPVEVTVQIERGKVTPLPPLRKLPDR
ncbi:MAG: hypothetical protein ACK47B_17930 [Armatimonadota bacterium]